MKMHFCTASSPLMKHDATNIGGNDLHYFVPNRFLGKFSLDVDSLEGTIRSTAISVQAQSL
jgi:hypothetical protein